MHSEVIQKIQHAAVWKRPALLYACIALCFGFVFVVITPPFFNADEPNHFYRVYQLSQGNVVSDYNPDHSVGGKIPTSFITTITAADPGSLALNPIKNYNLRTIEHATRVIPLNAKSTTAISFPNTALYSPVPYVPQIIAVKILSIVHAPAVYMLYLGRLFGMIAAVLLFAYAITKAPFAKWSFVAVGLLPMTLDAFSAFTADGITIALAALFVAMTFRFVYKKQLIEKNWDTLILCLATGGLALAKSTYAILLLLLVLLPLTNRAYRAKRQMLLLAGIFFGGALLALAWQHLTNIVTTISGDPTIVPKAQLAYVHHHLLWFITQPLASAFFSSAGNGIVLSFFGAFAWLTAPVPMVLILFEMLVLVFSCSPTFRGELAQHYDMHRTRWLTGAVAFICTLAVAVALYAYWTPVGGRDLLGLQGRYFIPIFIALLPVLKLRRLVLQEQTIRMWAIYGSSISLIATTGILIARFYIP